MDVQLQELIDKIKKDGVTAAEKQAAKIIAEAQEKAEGIISDAEAKGADIIKKAKAETARMEKSEEEAILQASRNMLLSFKESIVETLDGLVKEETAKATTAAVLKTLVPATVKAWAKNSDASEMSVLVAEKDLKALTAAFKTSLKAEIKKGLEIKPDKTIAAGFRIGVKNGAAFYDYSSDSISELFALYLNPKVAEILKTAAKEIE